MPIVYNKFFDLMKQRGVTVYRIRKDGVAGGAALEKMRGAQGGHVDTRTIENLCKYLGCQPGDIMEYVDE